MRNMRVEQVERIDYRSTDRGVLQVKRSAQSSQYGGKVLVAPRGR